MNSLNRSEALYRKAEDALTLWAIAAGAEQPQIVNKKPLLGPEDTSFGKPRTAQEREPQSLSASKVRGLQQLFVSRVQEVMRETKLSDIEQFAEIWKQRGYDNEAIAAAVAMYKGRLVD